MKIIIFLACLLMVSCSKEKPRVPLDKSSILESLNIEGRSTDVYEGRGGKGQKPVWVRFEIEESEMANILKNPNIIRGMNKSRTSKLVADNHATIFIDEYGSRMADTWIPPDFKISDGYESSSGSLAIYKSDVSSKLILIWTNFR